MGVWMDAFRLWENWPAIIFCSRQFTLFDEMSCSEENSLQNESDYQDGLLSKTTASEVSEEINKEVDMSKVLEAFETPINDEPKKYDVKHFTQLNKITGGEE